MIENMCTYKRFLKFHLEYMSKAIACFSFGCCPSRSDQAVDVVHRDWIKLK